MQDGEGIHVKYVPGTFIPLANKSNNYLLDRESQRHGHSSTGVDGIAMQDASIQESMGPIQDRTKEHLCATDKGIVMTRRILLRAAKAAADGGAVPATEPEAQRVRSASIELEKDVSFHAGRPSTDFMRRWEQIRSRCRLSSRYSAAVFAGLRIAALTRGMTSSAINCIERLASVGSTQSRPA